MTASHITGINHIVVGVKSLAEAVDTYARLGFALTPMASTMAWGPAITTS